MKRLANNPGVGAALLAAALFGASTPMAKALLGSVQPLMLAGVLYLGSGLGLATWLLLRALTAAGGQRQEGRLGRRDAGWLAGAIISGGAIGPVLLVYGLQATTASTASLMLNLEGVFTALLAWFVFRENYDRRIMLGMLAIFAGGVVLSWAGTPGGGTPVGPLAIAGACFAWALDNNLTRKVSAGDPVHIAMFKGLVAGAANVALALLLGQGFPAVPSLAGAAVVGLLGYGVSLVLFVRALRHIGAARSGAYFSLAPFFGATLAVGLLGERVTTALVTAAGLMGFGLWLHLAERHDHLHQHDARKHDHGHSHNDVHHSHEHTENEPIERHAHPHVHAATRHSHLHYPDLHHDHDHGHP